MKSAHLIYPHQLFKKEYLPQGVGTIFLIEDPLFFGTDQKYPVFFHKQKLILHRASMRRYIKEVLWPAGYEVEYIEFKDIVDSGDILQRLRGYESATVFDVVDDVLQRRLQVAANTIPEIPKLQFLDTPNFYLTKQEVTDYLSSSKNKPFLDFYQWQRERFNVLIDDNYKPVGGKWSFDQESRKRLPKEHTLPTFEVYGSNEFVEEARHYVAKNFPNNPGVDSEFNWATNHEEAEVWLNEFLKNRLEDFGLYQEAIDGTAPWSYHSAISSALNTGLLTPKQAVDLAIQRHEKSPVSLPSLESFVRQVLGWREYTRAVYQTQGVFLRSSNNYEHKRSLTQDWYDGTTGIPPVDDVIKKVQTRSYLHHVERLMIIGNIMFLSQINPNEVYQWFMEMTIDAYDWAVVPNVYGMSQFSDGEGGGMTVKPNISGSNYILQMSHYEKDDWCDIWDGLYWGFIEKHSESLSKNTHMNTTVAMLKRMNEDRRRIIGYRAADFLNTKTKTAP